MNVNHYSIETTIWNNSRRAATNRSRRSIEALFPARHYAEASKNAYCRCHTTMNPTVWRMMIMNRTRIGAAIFVLLLIGGLAVTGIALASWLGPMSAHGTNVLHVGGTVVQIGPEKNFVFKTDAEEEMTFVCNTDCRASLRHLVRHVKEKAHTDVYYVPGANHQWLVIDVD